MLFVQVKCQRTLWHQSTEEERDLVFTMLTAAVLGKYQGQDGGGCLREAKLQNRGG